MKQLVNNRKHKKLKEILLHMLLICTCIALIVFSTAYYKIRENNKDLVATLAAKSILDLSFGNITDTVSSIKRSLLLISRIPVMREFKSDDFFTHLAINKINNINLALESYAPLVGLSYYEYIKTGNNMVYWGELALATMRRILISLGFPLTTDEDERKSIINPLMSTENNKFKKQTDFANTLVNKAKDIVNKVLSSIQLVAHYIDSLSGLKRINLVDPKGAENLMATNLENENHIVSTEIRTFDGAYQAGVSELSSLSNLSNNQLRKSKFNQPFLSGPVSFKENTAKLLWNVFVPLRNRQRETIAYISSLVDLSFLNKIAKAGSFNKNISLFFVDESGTVIGHKDYSKVINQVNLKHSNRAVKKAMSGKSNCSIENIYGKKHIVAYRPLHQFASVDNPKWAMILIAKSESFTGQGGILMSLSLIVLAVMALYVLFYTARNLMILLYEENDNDI